MISSAPFKYVIRIPGLSNSSRTAQYVFHATP
jgi:hypothetical protein